MSKRVIISGGGTGGHIFPAISIANALRQIDSDIAILFVGAEGKIEMDKVPAAGYEIVGLPVAGFHRSFSLKNIIVVFKLFRSLRKAKGIIRNFKPDVVVGVGGYASGPVLRFAGKKGIPTLIQEQNSYAGLTNKLLSKKAARICVAYEGMDKYFPSEKILLSGNPVRKDISISSEKQKEGISYFNLKEDLPVVLVLGGSGGSKTINESIAAGLKSFGENNIQVIWQTGKYYYNDMKSIHSRAGYDNVKVMDFINRMDLAFSIADIIVTRAGAGTISELSIIARPVILIPSPNVAEDHQTKNAMALVKRNAAIMIKDMDAEEQLIDEILALLNNRERQNELSVNISEMALKDSDMIIAREVIKLTE